MFVTKDTEYMQLVKSIINDIEFFNEADLDEMHCPNLMVILPDNEYELLLYWNINLNKTDNDSMNASTVRDLYQIINDTSCTRCSAPSFSFHKTCNYIIATEHSLDTEILGLLKKYPSAAKAVRRYKRVVVYHTKQSEKSIFNKLDQDKWRINFTAIFPGCEFQWIHIFHIENRPHIVKC